MVSNQKIRQLYTKNSAILKKPAKQFAAGIEKRNPMNNRKKY